MKECLHCKKEFQQKRDTARYCSTSCRVMYNRKNPSVQKKKVELRLDVIYNSILDLIANHKSELPKDAQHITQMGVFKYNDAVEPMFATKLKIKRSYENYQQLRIDCPNAEEWNELKSEIWASDLPKDQKTLLTK